MSWADRGGARAALIAALVLGVALVVVIAVRTPWTVLPDAAGRPGTVDPTAGLSAAQVDRARGLRRRASGRPPCSRWCWGWWSPPSSGSPRSAAAWCGPSRAARRRLGLAGAARRAGPLGHRPAGHPAAVGLRRDGLAPLRAVHAQLGAVAARRRRRDGDRRRPHRARAAGAGLARPPGAAHLVGLGRPLGAAGLVVVGSFLWPVVIEPAFNRFESMPAGRCAATCCASRSRTARRCRTCWSPTPRRRTTALNAYVSGFGSTRRIVVYDTVLGSCPTRRSSRSPRTSSATWPPTTS